MAEVKVQEMWFDDPVACQLPRSAPGSRSSLLLGVWTTRGGPYGSALTSALRDQRRSARVPQFETENYTARVHWTRAAVGFYRSAWPRSSGTGKAMTQPQAATSALDP